MTAPKHVASLRQQFLQFTAYMRLPNPDTQGGAWKHDVTCAGIVFRLYYGYEASFKAASCSARLLWEHDSP